MREEQTSCPAAVLLLMIICLGGGVSRTLRFCNAACASEYLHRIFVYTYAICDINWLGGIPHPEAPCVKTMFIFLTETKPLVVVVMYSCISITPSSRHALNKHKKVSSHLFTIVIIFFPELGRAVEPECPRHNHTICPSVHYRPRHMVPNHLHVYWHYQVICIRF